MTSRDKMRDLLCISLAMLAAGAVFALLPRSSSDIWAPLPWDMSQHYLTAMEVRDALRAGSIGALMREVLSSNLYPPGHALLLGSWLFLWGESAASQFAFQFASLAFCIAGLWLCFVGHASRRTAFLGAAGALLAMAPIIALAGSFLVEAPAIAFTLGALGAVATAGHKEGGTKEDTRSLLHLALLPGLLMSAALLTKYNVGLPLLPSALIVAAMCWFRRRRRSSAALIIAVALAAAAVALYLTVQADGWHGLVDFARNRANSADWSMAARLRWYLDLFLNHTLPGPAWAVSILALAIFGSLRRRSALVLASWSFIGISVLAIARHPYLLDRNLAAGTAVLVIPAGLGVNELLGMFRKASVRLTLSALLVATWCVLASSARPAIRRQNESLQSPHLEQLASLSRFVCDSMRGTRSARVVGTFNEFSAGWVRILWSRAGHRDQDHLFVDFPYPLPPDRTGLDSRSDSIYAFRVTEWATAEPEERIVSLVVKEGGVWDTDDYRRWNAWKRNDTEALASLSAPRPEFLGAITGPNLSAQVFTLPTAPVRYGSGWGPVESWGRWAFARKVELKVRPRSGSDRLIFRVAPFDGLPDSQECVVEIAGREAARFSVRGAPWSWREEAIPLPKAIDQLDIGIVLRFSGLWPGSPTDSLRRALPFASVRMESTAAR